MRIEEKLAILAVLMIVMFMGVVHMESVYKPITSAAELQEYTKDKFGIDCTGSIDGHELIFRTSVMQGPDEYGYYGARETIKINGESKIASYVDYAECYYVTETNPDGTEKSGKSVFQITIDPNNGWIQQLVCNPTIISTCPTENGDYIQIPYQPPTQNPNYNTYTTLQ